MAETWNFDGDKVEFITFPVGTTQIQFVDKVPNVRWIHWLPQYRKSVVCPGKNCGICAQRKHDKANGIKTTFGMSKKIAMQAINLDTDKLVIVDEGITFFEDIRDLAQDAKEKGGDITDYIVRVKRRGTGKDDTSYRIDLDEKRDLTPQDEDLLGSKLNLSEYLKPHSPEQTAELAKGEMSWEDVNKMHDDEDEPSEAEQSQEESQNVGNDVTDEEIEIE